MAQAEGCPDRRRQGHRITVTEEITTSVLTIKIRLIVAQQCLLSYRLSAAVRQTYQVQMDGPVGCFALAPEREKFLKTMKRMIQEKHVNGDCGVTH